MPALTTILVDGDGEGPRAWLTQPFGSIDEGIAGADGVEIVAASGTTNRNTSLDTSFDTNVVEADIGNVDDLSYDVRYRADNSTGDDTVTFGIRVMSGATVLAAADGAGTFETVLSDLNSNWHTALQNKGVTAFTFVDTTADQAAWDAAEIEFRSTHAANMSPEDNWVIVDTVELIGNYTVLTAVVPIVALSNRPAPVPAPARPSSFVLLPRVPTDFVETVTDPVGVTDTVSRVHSAARTVTDPVGVTDAVTPAKASPRTVTDPVGVTDSVSAAKASPRTVTDPVGVTDDVSASKTITVTVTDPVGVTDTVSKVSAIARTVTDPIGVTDGTAAAKTATVTVTDPVGVTDNVAAAKAASQTVTDPVGVTDDTSFVLSGGGFTETVTDPVGVTDSVAAAKTITVTVTDPIGVTDTVAAAKSAAVTVTDPVGVTDDTSRALAIARTVTDPVGVTDDVDRALAMARTVTDPVGVTDSVVTGTSGFLVFADQDDPDPSTLDDPRPSTLRTRPSGTLETIG